MTAELLIINEDGPCVRCGNGLEYGFYECSNCGFDNEDWFYQYRERKIPGTPFVPNFDAVYEKMTERKKK